MAEGRKLGKVSDGNPSKRANYIAKTTFEPIEAEKLSFKLIINAICNNLTVLYHFDPDKTLFLQIDSYLEHGFGAIVYHLKDDI